MDAVVRHGSMLGIAIVGLALVGAAGAAASGESDRTAKPAKAKTKTIGQSGSIQEDPGAKVSLKVKVKVKRKENGKKKVVPRKVTKFTYENLSMVCERSETGQQTPVQVSGTLPSVKVENTGGGPLFGMDFIDIGGGENGPRTGRLNGIVRKNGKKVEGSLTVEDCTPPTFRSSGGGGQFTTSK